MSDSTNPPNREESNIRLTRRGFLVGASALGAAVSLLGGAYATGSGDVYLDPWIRADERAERVPIPESDGPRHWLAPGLWGNRLQDWRDHEEEAFTIECWPWYVDPTDSDAEQFPGWPYRLSFADADGR